MSSVSKITPSDSTSNRKLIGFAGLGRSGKSTCAEYMVANGFEEYTFSFPLKVALASMLGMSPERFLHMLKDPNFKESVMVPYDKTLRFMMQTLGTDWAREMIHPDFWIFAAQRFYTITTGPLVVADVRFENEAQWIRDNNGLVVHLYRSQREMMDNPEHESEAGVSLGIFDQEIVNDGTIDDLHKKLGALREHYDWLAI